MAVLRVVLLLLGLVVLAARSYAQQNNKVVGLKSGDRIRSRYLGDDREEDHQPQANHKFKESRCSYYCFFVPLEDERPDFYPYTSINCSHLVYGFAKINPQNQVDPATSYDMLYYDSFGNYRQITDLGHGKQMKVLLGIRGDGQVDHFMDSEWTHKTVAKSMVWNTRMNNFDGMFLDFSTHHLLSKSFPGFMQTLSDAITADQEEYPQQNRLMVVLGVSPRWLPQVTRRMKKFEDHFHSFYLWSDDTITSQDPLIGMHVDPLSQSSDKMNAMDTIKGNAEKLASSGIARSKIIVGLTGWARSYVFGDKVKGEHGLSALELGEPGNLTKRNDGRLAYFEICKLEGFNQTVYEQNASTTSFTGFNNHWYSFNKPKHESFQRKLKWISSYGFGGVGLFSLQADDVTGELCGEGILPVHAYVFHAYSCSIRRSDETRGKESGNQACTRLCSFNPDHATNSFNFNTLNPNWCSHIILSTAAVVTTPSIDVRFSPNARKIVMNYNAWSTKAKPYLILSIGEDQPPEAWRLALQMTKRPMFIEKLVKLMEDNGADGVDIAWTSVDNAVDMLFLNSLLTDLRANVTNTKQIFVCASSAATFHRQYDYRHLASMADYIVLQGYRFHSYTRPFTGHHSPLFGTRDVFNDPTLTIEGMVNKWADKVPAEKLIVALSAEAMSQFFRVMGNRSDRTIGDPANNQRLITSRANSPGKVTQTELCQILKNPTTRTQFIEAIGAPYLISGDEFIAYDDEKSMQIKAVWASMKNLGGIALHGMEMDNIAGECPSGNSFHLLKSFVKAQMCSQCTDPPQPIVLPAAVDSGTQLLQGIVNKTSQLLGSTDQLCGNAFRVVCTYKLPTDAATSALPMENLPYDRCDEIVVQKFRLNRAGKVEPEETLSKEVLANLTSMIEKNKLRTRFISSIHCFMSVEQLKKLLDKPSSSLVNEMIAHTNTYGYSGIELRCGHILRPEIKQKFAALLNALQEGLHAEPVDHNNCHKTVGMKEYPWRKDLTTIYEIPTLNKLHHISMETFQVSTISQVMLVEPLFDPNNQQLSIDSALSKWLKSGLKREIVVIELPTYGLTKKLFRSPVQTRSEGDNQPVEEDMMDVDKISQGDICELLKKEVKPKNTTLYLYEMIIDYKQTIDTAVSFESVQTIIYKTRYAIREGLAGVALSGLHHDDFANKCGKEAFPLLEAVKQAPKCNKPVIESKTKDPTNPSNTK